MNAPAPALPPDSRARVGRVVIVLACAVIFAATLLPVAQDVVSSRWCIICGEMGTLDVLLNVALFVPLGMGLALRGVPPRTSLAAAVLLTLAIECAQLGVVHGRDASVGDIVANSVGAGLGYLAGAHGGGWLRPSAPLARRLLGAWMVLWFAVQVVASYSLSPALTPHRYYGQIAPALGNLPPYPGRVLGATVGGEVIPDVAFGDSPRVRALLSAPDGAELDVIFVRADAPPSEAFAIVRIADDTQQEILSLSVRGRDVVYAMRTGAAVLRLRPVQFAMTDALPPPGSTAGALERDTVRVRIRSARREVEFAVDVNGTRRMRRYVRSLEHGWRLFTPAQYAVRGERSELVYGAAWAGLLLVPAGFLLAHCAVDGRRRGARAGWLAAGAAALLGTIGVPAAFGLPLGSVSVAGLPVGVLCGWGIGLRIRRHARLRRAQ